MILKKSELIASLQREVRLLLHLASNIDPAMRDYRPTPKQRSTIELLNYLSLMGPSLVRYAKGQPLDAAAMAEAMAAADARNFDQTLAAIGAHADLYASLLADMSDDDFAPRPRGLTGARRRVGSSSSIMPSASARPTGCNCFCI